MAAASYVQTSFAGGAWSQSAQGQSARPDYRTALNKCLNGLPTETAAWVRRPGFRHAGFTRGGAAGRLIRFDFKESSPYNMEFTDGHIRFWNGPNLATTNDDQVITSVSSATPAVVTTALAHGWATGDQVIFKSLGSTAFALQQRVCAITVLSSTTFSLADAITGVAIVGTALTDAAGTVARVLDIATTYLGGSWSGVRSVQVERKAVLLSSAAPQILSLTADPGASAFATFGLEAQNFKDGPYLDPYVGSIATPSAKVGNISLTFSFTAYSATVSYSKGDYASSGGHNYKSLSNANLNNTPASSPTFWQEVSGGDPVSPSGFVASDVGRHIRLYSEPAAWASGTAYVAKDVVLFNDLYWEAIASSTGSQPGQDVTKWQLRTGEQYALWSWGRITAVSGAGIISGVLAGSVNIGNMTAGGGLAAAFDGTTTKVAASCAQGAHAGSPTSGYAGKNYSGAAAQQIAQVIVHPSTDFGFGAWFAANGTGSDVSVTLNLRAKATAPASASDGTLLGTSGAFANGFAPRSISSVDQVTTWNYVWVEIIIVRGGGFLVAPFIAQVVFFAPNVANGSVVTLQIAGDPLLYTSAIRTWRAGAFSDAAGWPRCGTYLDGRLWLSGAYPNRVDAGKAGDLFNFAPTEKDGTVTDASGISYVFNLPDINPVFWMEPDEQGIICGTQAGEIVIDNGTAGGGPIKPTAIRARRRTAVKCANVLPARCDHTLVFVQKNTRRLMEYFADVYSGKFQAPNLIYLAKHFGANGLSELAFQRDLVPVVWARTGVGGLVGMAYKRDSNISAQAPVLMGWHEHTHGAGWLFTSLVVGPSVGADLETLAAVTSDGTHSHVELLTDVLEETDDLEDAAQLDAHVVPSTYVISADRTSMNLYGLHAHNGNTVTVWAGGLDCGEVAVAGGLAILPFGDGIAVGPGGGLFTADFVDTFGGNCPIRIGYTYTSRGQLLRPASPEVSGTRTGPAFAKERRSHRLGIQVVGAKGISIGTVFGKLRACKFTLPDLRTKLTPLQAFTGIYKESAEDDYSLDSMPCWEITRPYPATVTAFGAFLSTQDQ